MKARTSSRLQPGLVFGLLVAIAIPAEARPRTGSPVSVGEVGFIGSTEYGRYPLIIVADNNFNAPFQRTLFLAFAGGAGLRLAGPR